jgi:hypothetical protein
MFYFMITKKATINLTQEEIDSPEDIQTVLTVNGPDRPSFSTPIPLPWSGIGIFSTPCGGIINTILFTKDKPKSLPPLEDLLNAGR